MRRRLETPQGFVPRVVDGRLVYKATDPSILDAHDSLVAMLLAPYGLRKCSMPDQIVCIHPHLPYRFFLKMDLQDAFGTMTVFGTSVVLQLDDEFEETWRYFFHKEGGLIQGAPASPILFHLFMQKWIEPDLAVLCEELGLTWTRYVDDFLFSSPRFISTGAQKRLRRFFKEKGFAINGKKTRAVDIFNESFTYLGMVVTKYHIDVTDEVKSRIAGGVPDSPSIKGLLHWRARVLALNGH